MIDSVVPIGPVAPSSATELVETGAESVLRSLLATAERVPDGIRWQTLDYQNEPHYDTNLYNGVAGISLFLSDYYRLAGDDRARELAEGALRWCMAADRPPGKDPAGLSLPQSLYSGIAGLGLAWLRLALATHSDEALTNAARLGLRLADAPVGPWAELGRGAVGETLSLVRLWEATGDARHLAGAVRRGEWLQQTAIRDEHGCHWLRVAEAGNPRSRSLTGLHVGNAGIGYLLLVLHRATGEPCWATLAREAADTLLRQARPDRLAEQGWNWPHAIGGGEDFARCQWCVGAPGIGFFLAHAAALLGEPAYRAGALAAAETTYAHGDVRRNPSQCHGLAGSAECFLALYRLTRTPIWLDRAYEFARQAIAYRTDTAEGERWQADEPGISSPDFFCGAAGIGHFFLRLRSPDTVALPFV